MAGRLTLPTVQSELLVSSAMAALGCGLAWMGCVLVMRAIHRAAAKPYMALAHQMEDLADGRLVGALSTPGSGVDVRRLARAAAAVQHRLTASERAEDLLQARYDDLCRANAEERRMLMRIAMEGRCDRIDAQPSPPKAPDTSLDLPPWPADPPYPRGGDPTAHSDGLFSH